MTVSRPTVAASFSLGLLILASVVFYYTPFLQAQKSIHRLSDPLMEAIDHSLTGDYLYQPRVEIWRHLEQVIETDLDNLITTYWFTPVKQCSAELIKLNGVITESSRFRQSIVLARNDLSLEIELGLSCRYNYSILLFWVGMFLIPCVLTCLLLKSPPSHLRMTWVRRLKDDGYTFLQAIKVTEVLSGKERLNTIQRQYLNHFYRPNNHNFEHVLNECCERKIATLTDEQFKWLINGSDEVVDGDLDSALLIANTEARIVFDLNSHTLEIHGRIITMAKTPFFYYVWYAQRRINGDGWYANPQSNKPNVQDGQDLATLMSKYHGHAKAIDDLEQFGLKAKALDQNRSKIKLDLVAALGESLAAPYLFDVDKDTHKDRTRYRLRLEGFLVQIVGGSQPS